MPDPPTWMSTVARVFMVPALALLWWALGFLAWQSSGQPTAFESLRPTLPIRLTDLGVAVFGPLGASLVVIGLYRRWGLALLSVGLGYLVSASVTLIPGAAPFGWSPTPLYVNSNERLIMLVLTAVMALAGLGIGLIAIGSLRSYGFFGLLAVSPVVTLLAAVLLDPRSATVWMTGAALVVLLLMIAWRRWQSVVLWPAFLLLFWLLRLAMTAVDYGGQTLGRRGGGVSVGFVAEAMLDIVRSSWRLLLGLSWDIFWPAAVVAGLVILGRFAWRRTAPSDR
jgi:hypothetical protein